MVEQEAILNILPLGQTQGLGHPEDIFEKRRIHYLLCFGKTRNAGHIGTVERREAGDDTSNIVSFKTDHKPSKVKQHKITKASFWSI